jgi:hypothetical protein
VLGSLSALKSQANANIEHHHHDEISPKKRLCCGCGFVGQLARPAPGAVALHLQLLMLYQPVE